MRITIFLKYILSLAFVLIIFSVKGQLNVDVKSYAFTFDLYNKSDTIQAKAEIKLRIIEAQDSLKMHLQSVVDGKGMEIQKLNINGQEVHFKHEGDVLSIMRAEPFKKSEFLTIKAEYHGVPQDGLVISENKHGRKTYFGDNWPNRARHWLLSHDHPSDKAKWLFAVNAPENYKAVANGMLITRETRNRGQLPLLNRWVWMTEYEIPTKVAVIGVAPFAISDTCYHKNSKQSFELPYVQAEELPGWLSHDIALNSWIFEEQAEDGFHDYEPACEIVEWFSSKLGPYPFQKLANVQSKTRYGGMENAGCIFYYEESVNGEQAVNSLVAHEIAHQWFGNSATEKDWVHLWLSEGFATYLTDLYLLENSGDSAYLKSLAREREIANAFNERSPNPIVNLEESNPRKLLNPNVYQRAAWVLYMLHQKVGDDVFWNILRKYYYSYAYSNATTDEFVKIANELSSNDLSEFFNQWLYRSEIPKIEVTSKIKGNKVKLKIEQLQDGNPYSFPLEISFISKSGQVEVTSFNIDEKKKKYEVILDNEVERIEIDPRKKLLFKLESSK